MKFIYGNTDGIRKHLLDKLSQIRGYQFEKLLPYEMYQQLLSISEQLNREIAIGINKKGKVEFISIGNSQQVPVPRNSYLIIHTHPQATSELSELDLSLIHSGQTQAIMAIGSFSDTIQIAKIDDSHGLTVEKYTLQDLAQKSLDIIGVEGSRKNKIEDIDLTEKALLIAFDEEGALELEELCKTAGIQVLDCEIIKLRKIHTGLFVGKGKIVEIKNKSQVLQANLLVFDHELSPVQLRNIEEITGQKVVDRTTLILDIFAQRAQSREGKLQVELAQLKHLLPRLTGQGNNLSRLGGGVGTRGPGETKLEQDRRKIKKKIVLLTQELAEIQKHRQNQHKQRATNNIPHICLTGYTNAGKSTLLNLLANANVLAEDKLFATLDTTTRRLQLPSGRWAVLTDTVGFIRNLPPGLIAAFRATLEEHLRSDLILHVVDASNPFARQHIKVVEAIIKDLNLETIKQLIVFNKIDLLNDLDRLNILLHDLPSDYVCISALKKTGIDELLTKIDSILNTENVYKDTLWFFPYNQASLISLIRKHGHIVEEKYTDSGILIKGRVENRYSAQLEIYEK